MTRTGLASTTSPLPGVVTSVSPGTLSGSTGAGAGATIEVATLMWARSPFSRNSTRTSWVPAGSAGLVAVVDDSPSNFHSSMIRTPST